MLFSVGSCCPWDDQTCVWAAACAASRSNAALFLYPFGRPRERFSSVFLLRPEATSYASLSRWCPAPSRPRPATSSSRFAAHRDFFPSSCVRSSPSATIIPNTSSRSRPSTLRPTAASWTPTSASGRVRVRLLTSPSRTSASCRAGSAPRPPSSSPLPSIPCFPLDGISGWRSISIVFRDFATRC